MYTSLHACIKGCTCHKSEALEKHFTMASNNFLAMLQMVVPVEIIEPNDQILLPILYATFLCYKNTFLEDFYVIVKKFSL